MFFSCLKCVFLNVLKRNRRYVFTQSPKFSCSFISRRQETLINNGDALENALQRQHTEATFGGAPYFLNVHTTPEVVATQPQVPVLIGP